MRSDFRWLLAPLMLILPSGSMTGQAPSATSLVPALPKEPAEIFAAAATLYDLTSPTLKPWHLKASYELYDKKDKPTEQGTYEYWWAAPDAYRSTWKRAGMEHTDWIVGGKHFDVLTGPPLSFFEEKLPTSLLHALPATQDLKDARLASQERSFGGVKLPCVMKVPMSASGMKETPPLGMFPTYCFGPEHVILRAGSSFASSLVTYNSIVWMQGRLVARDVSLFAGRGRVLTAKVEAIDLIEAGVPELTPTPDAKSEPRTQKVKVGPGVTPPKVIKSVDASFPDSERQGNRDGAVELQLTVGTDGRVHDVTVVSGTTPDFVSEALRAVLQYEFRPAILNGEPVESEITFDVRFKHT